MNDEELEKIIAPALGTLKNISYEEAVIVCNVLGRLRVEIKKLSNYLNIFESDLDKTSS